MRSALLCAFRPWLTMVCPQLTNYFMAHVSLMDFRYFIVPRQPLSTYIVCNSMIDHKCNVAVRCSVLHHCEVLSETQTSFEVKCMY